MKKTLFALLAVAFASSLCSIQLPLAMAEGTKTFVGTIKDLRIAPLQFRSGPPLWPFAMITVKADSGDESNFLLVGSGQHATLFYEENGKQGTAQSIKAMRGKKAEVKYVITAETMRYANKQLALSVRCVPADYVPQSTVSPLQGNAAATAKADEAKILVGTVKNVSAVLGREPNWTYNKIEVSGDNGDNAAFFVMRRTVITDLNGKDLSGKRVQKGKKVEIKFSVLSDSSYVINGQKGADSIHYLD